MNNFTKNKMTDLEAFVELYSRFGITCHVNQEIDTGNQFILLVEGRTDYILLTEGLSDYDSEKHPKLTRSDKLIGYSGFYSRIDFDKDGTFISQGFWE